MVDRGINPEGKRPYDIGSTNMSDMMIAEGSHCYK